MSIDEIYQSSKITSADLNQVRQALNSGAGGRDTHRAIEILGRAGSPARDSALVHDFVGHADPAIAAVALHVLVDVWNLGERYRSDLKRLISGIAEDEFGDATTQAVSSAGKYLRDRRDWDQDDCALYESIRAAATDETNLTAVRQW